MEDTDATIRITRKAFEERKSFSFTDTLYDAHFENAEAFEYSSGEERMGVLEVNLETWSKRLRITELLVYAKHRRQGVGTKLMEHAKRIAKEKGCRQVVLETQSRNVPALDFYRKCGFRLIGLDTACYSNEDIQKKEVRLEMGWNVKTKG